jgi:hypothetical protein
MSHATAVPRAEAVRGLQRCEDETSRSADTPPWADSRTSIRDAPQSREKQPARSRSQQLISVTAPPGRTETVSRGAAGTARGTWEDPRPTTTYSPTHWLESGGLAAACASDGRAEEGLCGGVRRGVRERVFEAGSRRFFGEAEVPESGECSSACLGQQRRRREAVGRAVGVANPETGRDLSVDLQTTAVQRAVVRAPHSTTRLSGSLPPPSERSSRWCRST